MVVTGELVNKTGASAQIRHYLEIVKSVDAAIPLYNVAENHDVCNEPTTASLAAYRRLIGKDYYTFEAGSVRGSCSTLA